MQQIFGLGIVNSTKIGVVITNGTDQLNSQNELMKLTSDTIDKNLLDTDTICDSEVQRYSEYQRNLSYHKHELSTTKQFMKVFKKNGKPFKGLVSVSTQASPN